MTMQHPDGGAPDPFRAAREAAMLHPAAKPDDDLAQRLDLADMVFGSLEDTAAVLPGEDFPSVAIRRFQEHSGGHLPRISSKKTGDPYEALAGVTNYPAAVHEEVTDVDSMFELPIVGHRWYGMPSMAAAQQYVDSVGGRITLPGSGEADFTDIIRTAHVNPYFVAPESGSPESQ